MAKKQRVLNERGEFVDFKGTSSPIKVASPESKIAARKEIEDLAHKFGFSPNNPAQGGLSDADKKFIESNNAEAITALYKVRGVENGELPEGDKAPDVVKELSPEDIDAITAGISIPEMRKMAKNIDLVIPKEIKKAKAIQEFLLSTVEEDEL